jgi:flagellar biosynthesis GTPase FlhF
MAVNATDKMKKYPLTLAAIKTAEQNQWAIGDALIAECGPPSQQQVKDGSYVLLHDAAIYLLAEGFEYNIQTLAMFRNTAHLFRPSKRLANIAFGVHRVAATPEYLEAIITGAPKGTKITQLYVEGIRKAQADTERREREKAEEKARQEREKAEREEAEAKARVREAEAEEKEKAEAELKKAKEKTEKAKNKEAEVKTAPKKKSGFPAEKEVPELAVRAQFTADAIRSVKLARKAVKELKGYLDQLSPVSVRALTEVALEAANAWTEAAHIVRSETKEQRGHLSVVGE